MKKQFLLSLILALLFFTPSYAQEDLESDPIDILESLHNLPPNSEKNPKVQEMAKAIKEERSANDPITDGLETDSE